MRHLLTLLLSLALVAPGAAPALGKSKKPSAEEVRAKELYKNGELLYQEGRYEDAVAAFEESYRLSKRHVLLYNIANAWERAGELQKAVDALNRFRAFADGDEREVLAQRIRNLERRIEEEKAAAPAPAPEPAPAPAPAPAPEPEPAPALTPAPAPPAQTPAPPAPDPSTSAAPVWPWAVLGAGVAALGVGTFFGLRARSAHDDAEAACRGGACSPAVDDAIDREESSALAADLSFALGAAATVTGAVLLLTLDGDAPADAGVAPLSLSAGPTPNGGGLQVTARW